MTQNCQFGNEDILPDNLLEEFLEMKCNCTAKDDFEVMPLNELWAKYLNIYENVGSAALQTLLPFSSTYLCESGFSTLVNLKTKCRSKLDEKLICDVFCLLQNRA